MFILLTVFCSSLQDVFLAEAAEERLEDFDAGDHGGALVVRALPLTLAALPSIQLLDQLTENNNKKPVTSDAIRKKKTSFFHKKKLGLQKNTQKVFFFFEILI